MFVIGFHEQKHKVNIPWKIYNFQPSLRVPHGPSAPAAVAAHVSAILSAAAHFDTEEQLQQSMHTHSM